MAFDLDPDYKQVPERLADLKAIHPDARLRPVDELEPFKIVTIPSVIETEGGPTEVNRTFIVYAAACYRDETDALPAIGVAWEPFPGTTPYTRNSELMNAETSAWGRAIIAALRSESKSIASAEDVRNRQAEDNVPAPQHPRSPQATQSATSGPSPAQMSFIKSLMADLGMSAEDARGDAARVAGRPIEHLSDLTKAEASRLIDLWKPEEA